jgi:diacylglycerol kinase family enzyme
MRVAILFHENAGEGVSGQDLCKAIASEGHDVVDLIADDADLEGAFAEAVELVVAAGGDGTVFRAANAVADRNIPIAILPLGTANNIAVSLGLDGETANLIARWKKARRMRFDVGIVRAAWGESRFLEGVGAGLIPAGIASMDADPSPAADAAETRLVGAAQRFRDVLSRLQPRRVTLTLDGERLEDAFLLVEVLNIRSVGPILVLSADADPSDGVFSVVTATEDQRGELDAFLSDRIEGRIRPLSLPARRVRHVAIEGCEELHLDDQVHRGSRAETIEVQVKPASLQFLVWLCKLNSDDSV